MAHGERAERAGRLCGGRGDKYGSRRLFGWTTRGRISKWIDASGGLLVALNAKRGWNEMAKIPEDFLREYLEYLDDVRRAQARGLCVNCGEPALPKCYSDAGRREYRISGMCEPCFDKLTQED